MSDTACDAYLREHDARQLEELKTLLRIPSISSLPEHRDDMRQAAEWVADQLRTLGAQDVALLPTHGNPVVYGVWPAPEGAPTAILYGHYDVQPPDPLDLWETAPFEPTIRDGRLYARGAADDKGNMFAAIKGIEAYLAVHGSLPIGLKCMFEGEEEIGSPNLHQFVRDNAALLDADFTLSADGGMWGPDTPSLTVSSKGIAACQIDLRTANTDLHSGQHGAATPNAVEALARLVTTMHDDAGRVTVAGFYEPVRDLTAEERAQIAAVPFDEEEYRTELALPALWGEPGYTVNERRGARPTLDLNGIWGGFTGEGLKTVTPAEAHAKITCRLVPNQEPGDDTGRHRGARRGALPARRDGDRPPLPRRGAPLQHPAGSPGIAGGARRPRRPLRQGTARHPARRHPADRGDAANDARRGHGLLLLGHAGRSGPCAERVLPPRRLHDRPAAPTAPSSPPSLRRTGRVNHGDTEEHRGRREEKGTRNRSVIFSLSLASLRALRVSVVQRS